MQSFKNWLSLLEIGTCPEPGDPEKPTISAIPVYSDDDKPPTPVSNALRRQQLLLDRKKRMKKK